MSLPRPSRQITAEKATEAESAKPPVTKYNENKFRPSDVFLFDPMADIDAYELAYLLKILYEPAVHFKNFIKLPQHIQRHFRPAKT